MVETEKVFRQNPDTVFAEATSKELLTLAVALDTLGKLNKGHTEEVGKGHNPWRMELQNRLSSLLVSMQLQELSGSEKEWKKYEKQFRGIARANDVDLSNFEMSQKLLILRTYFRRR